MMIKLEGAARVVEGGDSGEPLEIVLDDRRISNISVD